MLVHIRPGTYKSVFPPLFLASTGVCYIRASLQYIYLSNVADPGCLSRIPEPNFSIPDPGSNRFRILDPHPRILVGTVRIFNPKNCYKALGKISRFVHPGSRILTFYPSRNPDPGSRGEKGTGSRIRIRNFVHTKPFLGESELSQGSRSKFFMLVHIRPGTA
jgi:hypothetical protein